MTQEQETMGSSVGSSTPYEDVWGAFFGALLVGSGILWGVGKDSMHPNVWAIFGFLMALGGCGAAVGLFLSTTGSSSYLRALGQSALAGACWWSTMAMGLFGTTVATQWSGDLADHFLAGFERAIGLTQPEVLSRTLGISGVLAVAYQSLVPQTLATIAYFSGVSPDHRLLWRVAAVTSVVTFFGVILYMLLPAEGPYSYYGPAVYPQGMSPPSFLEPFRAMRGLDPTVVPQLDGFVAAPSFHAISATMLAGLWWRSKHVVLRVSGVGLNGVMLLATWVCGAHYLTDLVIGILLVVAVGAILPEEKTEQDSRGVPSEGARCV